MNFRKSFCLARTAVKRKRLWMVIGDWPKPLNTSADRPKTLMDTGRPQSDRSAVGPTHYVNPENYSRNMGTVEALMGNFFRAKRMRQLERRQKNNRGGARFLHALPRINCPKANTGAAFRLFLPSAGGRPFVVARVETGSVLCPSAGFPD